MISSILTFVAFVAGFIAGYKYSSKNQAIKEAQIQNEIEKKIDESHEKIAQEKIKTQQAIDYVDDNFSAIDGSAILSGKHKNTKH